MKQNNGAFYYNKESGELKEVTKENVIEFIQQSQGMWCQETRDYLNKSYKEIVKDFGFKKSPFNNIYFEMLAKDKYLFILIDKVKDDLIKALQKAKLNVKDSKEIIKTKEQLNELERGQNPYCSRNEDFKIGDVRCYLNKELVMPYKNTILLMDKMIKAGLKDNSNYNGLSITGEAIRYMCVKTSNKQIKNYYYGPMIKLYSFDEAEVKGVINEIIKGFKMMDNDKDIKRQKDFIADGEKYGWD